MTDERRDGEGSRDGKGSKGGEERKGDAVIGRELSSGAFIRQDSHFRDWVVTGGELPVEAGRYHLYVSLACPWCHRTAIVHALAGLEQAVGISYVAPFRDERGWAFTGERFEVGAVGNGAEHWVGEYVDRLHGWQYMSEAYRVSDPSFDARITVPVLWDTHTERIVNNESSEIIRMLASPDSLGALGEHRLDLCPEALRAEIDQINERTYEHVNNGVYRAGFARHQDSYEEAFEQLFDALGWLEELLGHRRYLTGEQITEADWRLFPTLVRFDEVYHTHFRCNRRRIVEYPNLWGYTRELYQWPGVSQTVAMDQIKRHYYTTHDELNPKHIVPVGPAPEWDEPHRRG
jgi:glutathionyl-hydroquinone reductase